MYCYHYHQPRSCFPPLQQQKKVKQQFTPPPPPPRAPPPHSFLYPISPPLSLITTSLTRPPSVSPSLSLPLCLRASSHASTLTHTCTRLATRDTHTLHTNSLTRTCTPSLAHTHAGESNVQLQPCRFPFQKQRTTGGGSTYFMYMCSMAIGCMYLWLDLYAPDNCFVALPAREADHNTYLLFLDTVYI